MLVPALLLVLSSAAIGVWAWACHQDFRAIRTCRIINCFGLMTAAWLLSALPTFAACALRTVPIPIRMEGATPWIPAKVNGRDVSFALDSRATYDSLSSSFALDHKQAVGFQALGAEPGQAPLAVVAQLQVGTHSFKDRVFATSELGTRNVLGARILNLGDVDFDLGHAAINLVFPQDCKSDPLAYWLTPGQAFSVLPLEPKKSLISSIFADVSVNGVRLRAVFDTDSPASYITRRAAARVGADFPGADAAKGEPVKPQLARFVSIKIGDEEIKDGALQVVSDDAATDDVVIGADFLLSHHVYVAWSQSRIYLSYNGGRVFDTALEPKEPQPPPANVMAHPNWVRRPTGQDMARNYPPQAVRAVTPGDAVIRCRVTADGLLSPCVVLAESPADVGFGAAALALAPLFKIGIAKGERPIGGAIVTVPIRWRIVD